MRCSEEWLEYLNIKASERCIINSFISYKRVIISFWRPFKKRGDIDVLFYTKFQSSEVTSFLISSVSSDAQDIVVCLSKLRNNEQQNRTDIIRRTRWKLINFTYLVYHTYNVFNYRIKNWWTAAITTSSEYHIDRFHASITWRDQCSLESVSVPRFSHPGAFS